MKVVVYRPGCSARRTVFENQLSLYDELQRTDGFEFKIIVDQDDFEPDERFLWTLISASEWKSFRGRRWFLRYKSKVAGLAEAFRGAERVVTLDPTVYPQAHLAFDVARKLGIPVWIDSTITLLAERLFNRWRRRGFNKVKADLEYCERILIPSPKVVERFASLNLTTPEICKKFHLLGHAIDTERFRLDHNFVTPQLAKTLLCVSRLKPEKGIAYILEAFLQALPAIPDTQLVFLGTGEMFEYVAQRTPDDIFGKTVKVESPVAHSQLHLKYQSASAYISHSLEVPYWEEYFGVATLEAMASGLPVLVTPTGAVPFVLRGASAVHWTAPRDVSALADSIITVLNDNIQGAKMAQNRSFIEANYSLKAVAEKWKCS